MLDDLDREERILLMKFLCSFAWADLSVHQTERDFIRHMAKRLDLSDDETTMARGWLEVPPRPEEIDPEQVPAEHRQLFLDAARAMVITDGDVDMEELENLRLLEQLLS